jgi:hypothetical protein
MPDPNPTRTAEPDPPTASGADPVATGSGVGPNATVSGPGTRTVADAPTPPATGSISSVAVLAEATAARETGRSNTPFCRGAPMRTASCLFVLVLWTIAANGDDKEEIAALVKDLRSKTEKTRLTAIEKLAAMGPKAKPDLKDVCDRLVDPSPKVATAALVAVEKIDPELYKPLSSYLLTPPGKGFAAYSEALEKLTEMKEKVKPASLVLIARWHAESANPTPSTQIADALHSIIKGVKPNDAESIKAIKAIATKPLPARDNAHAMIRGQAMLYLASWATGDEAKCKEVLPIVKSAWVTHSWRFTRLALPVLWARRRRTYYRRSNNSNCLPMPSFVMRQPERLRISRSRDVCTGASASRLPDYPRLMGEHSATHGYTSANWPDVSESGCPGHRADTKGDT